MEAEVEHERNANSRGDVELSEYGEWIPVEADEALREYFDKPTEDLDDTGIYDTSCTSQEQVL